MSQPNNNYCDEFIEAYSDDQIYLTMIEDLVNEHPIEANVPDNIKYSSFSRLWLVMMVGAIESMIKCWNNGNVLWSDIASYLDRQPNNERVDNLANAFKNIGLDIDSEMFKDFLAFKYIRNAYIHSNWNDSQRNYVASRNFPKNVMNFEKDHFERMKAVYIHILNNLGMAKKTVLDSLDSSN